MISILNKTCIYLSYTEKEVKAMERILQYMKTLGLRPLELMREFDKTTSNEVSERDFIRRIKVLSDP